MKYSTLACLGPDALTFLQGQLSCDMREIGPERLSLGCYCNLKGRVFAAPYIYSVPEGFHLILPADLAPAFIQSLSRVIAFSKATLTDISAQHPATPVLENPQFEIAPGVGFTLGPVESAPTDAWLAALITHKIPTIALAQSEKFLPHYIGMIELGAVSFTKGCYLGQEIIARMHYKGNLKKHLVCQIDPPESDGDIVNSVEFSGKSYVLAIVGT